MKVELLPNMSESGYTTSFEKSNGKITATLEKTISETTSTFTVTFSLDATESYKYLTIENGKAYLILKYKESSILTIDTNTSGNDTDLYVLSYTPEHTNLVTEENPPTMSGDSYENYYNQHKTRTFTIVNLNDTSLISSQINFYLGFLQTNIQTQFYNENGSLLNACSGNYANLKLSVNDFGDIQNSTTLVNLQNDEFVFTANGYYQVDYIDVIDLSNNNTQRISFSEIDVGDGNKQSWTNTSTRILTKFYTGEKDQKEERTGRDNAAVSGTDPDNERRILPHHSGFGQSLPG